MSMDTYVDSDWAGCKSTRRSTSGGGIKIGWHAIKTWSSTQATVALSSAEAELYSMTKGAAQTLGVMALAQDFGRKLSAKVHSDASAALGIVARQGLGKMRHLDVQYLWLQDKVRDGSLTVMKVPGQQNPADMLTKHVPAADVHRHMETLSMKVRNDRADIAPKLDRINDTTRDDDDHGDGDGWQKHGECLVRVHAKPRQALFTPLRVAGSPPAKALTAVRITEGVFCDNNEAFARTDNWTSRSAAHLDLGRRWTGSTRFIARKDRS